MAIHYISGSAAKNNGGAISGLHTDGSQVDAVGNVVKSATTPRAKVCEDVTSIAQVAGSTVEGIQRVDGSFAFRLAGSVAAGTAISITGADYPINGTYLVHSTSGAWSLTSTPYNVCGTISASGNYTTSSTATDIDPAAQRESLIVGYTTSVGGSSTTSLYGGCSPNNKRDVHKFEGYRHWVYNDGYHCWDGVVNHCDYACSGITLGTDNAAEGNPTVIFDSGSRVRASDLDPPDTTDDRDPTQGTVDITDTAC